MEPNRPWLPNWEGLNVCIQRSLTLQRTRRHPHKFFETSYVHLPYDTLPSLKRFRPDVLISGELGLRTLQAVLYRKFNPDSRIVLWATLSEHTELGCGRLRGRLRQWLLPQADAVLVNGESGARYIRQFGVLNEQIFRVPYTTEMAAFSAVPAARSANHAYRLLYVGQLVERKGLVPFLSTLSRWAADHTDRRLEVWLVGDGPLRPTIEALSLAPNIALRCWGNVAYAELPSVYTQAGILMFPTLADEWGLVVNEAMASGLPVLGSVYSQAVEELVVDGLTGWSFHPDKPSEMYDALNRAFSTPTDELNRMRLNSRERTKHLTPELVANSILQAIQYVV